MVRSVSNVVNQSGERPSGEDRHLVEYKGVIMGKRTAGGLIAITALLCGCWAQAASAANPIRLYLNEGDAFAILGHSCGGIQQKVYATGFATNGYPMGEAHLTTRCGGSGRGGGYKTTTYTGSASVVWTWFGETRSYGILTSPEENPTFSAEDGHKDRVYNENGAAYLQTGEPPLQAPSAPTEVSVSVGLAEQGESEFLRMYVSWSVAGETAPLLNSSTITATPLHSGAPVLSTSVGSYFSSASLQPVAPNTTYAVTVTNTDSEGTSDPSTPVEITSPNSDGEAEHGAPKTEICEHDQGTIALSPGLGRRAAVQTILVSGQLGACDGPFGFESATYTASLKTTEKVGCAVLASSSLEANTIPLSFAVTWTPAEEGRSDGSLQFPLSETSLGGIQGTLEGGPFSAPASMTANAISETFAGSESCGQKVNKKRAKPVRLGTFIAGATEIG